MKSSGLAMCGVSMEMKWTKWQKSYPIVILQLFQWDRKDCRRLFLRVAKGLMLR